MTIRIIPNDSGMRKRIISRKKPVSSGRRKNYRISRFRKSVASRPSRTYYLRKGRKAKKIALASSIILASAGLFYFACYSDFFMIREIEIRRPENRYSCIEDGDISGFIEPFLHTRRLLIFPQCNALFFDSKIAERIIRQNLVVDFLKISGGPGKITIDIREKLPEAVLSKNGRRYFLSADGLTVGQLPQGKECEELPLIRDADGKGVEMKEEALDESVVSFAVETAYLAAEKFKGSPDISYFETIDPATADIAATVSEGWAIYLDSSVPAGQQLDNLALILEEQVKERRPELEYVDLRLGSKVFYKFKGE